MFALFHAVVAENKVGFSATREDRNVLVKFQEKPLHNYKMESENWYHDLVNARDEALPPFGSMYLCEVIFSAITAIKTK